MCTMEFAMVMVEISDTSNPSLNGIRTESVWMADGSVLHAQQAPGGTVPDQFRVCDDGDLKKMGYNHTGEIQFRIYKNNSLVKSELFVIRTDCCHVRKSSGPEQISLN